MGIENRDYIRDNDGGGLGAIMSDTPSCKRIIIATVVIFIMQTLFLRTATQADFERILPSESIDRLEEDSDQANTDQPNTDQPSPDQPNTVRRDLDEREPDQYDAIPAEAFGPAPKISVFEEWLELDTDKVLQGQVWRLLSTAFLHDRFGISHILFNMLFLYWFGISLESNYGSREFLLFYVVSAIVASLAFMALQLFTGDRVPAIGASGAVMAVTCLFTMWNPGYEIRLYFLFPIPIKYLLLIYVVYDLHPVLLSLAGTPTFTGVGHAAHLGGLAFGFFYWRNGWRLEPLVDRWMPEKTGRRPPQSRNATGGAKRSKISRDEKFDNQIDEILAKISVEGEGNLTPKERKLLNEASRRYRERQ